MFRWIVGVSLRDRKISEYIRREVRMASRPIVDKVREARLQ